jgi:hypothetical protein
MKSVLSRQRFGSKTLEVLHESVFEKLKYLILVDQYSETRKPMLVTQVTNQYYMSIITIEYGQ